METIGSVPLNAVAYGEVVQAVVNTALVLALRFSIAIITDEGMSLHSYRYRSSVAGGYLGGLSIRD